MKRADVIARLKAVEPALRDRGIGGLFLFGSIGRDDAGPTSDIDLFVDAASDAFYDLGNYTGAYRCIRETFPGIEVGYSTRNGLSKYIRATAEREAVRVF